jgi:isopenicillin N synthase-like dioxygenase
MASSTLFEGIPPFPDDIPAVSMNTVSLAGLRENDAKVVAACKELGFFFLDLRGDSMGDAMIECIDQLFTIGQEIFDLPESVKHQYLHDIPRSFLGYERLLSKGTVKLTIQKKKKKDSSHAVQQRQKLRSQTDSNGSTSARMVSWATPICRRSRNS